MTVPDLIATVAATEATEPRIELLGVELTGAAAWTAFAVSLISIAQALVALIRWIRDLLIPIRLEAFFSIFEAESETPELAQLKVSIYNGDENVRDLNRLEVWYDPGWWKRRVPGWHLKVPSSKPKLQPIDHAVKARPIGWSAVYPVVESPDKDRSLIVVAGYSRKRVRATKVQKLGTPIYAPSGD